MRWAYLRRPLDLGPRPTWGQAHLGFSGPDPLGPGTEACKEGGQPKVEFLCGGPRPGPDPGPLDPLGIHLGPFNGPVSAFRSEIVSQRNPPSGYPPSLQPPIGAGQPLRADYYIKVCPNLPGFPATKNTILIET